MNFEDRFEVEFIFNVFLIGEVILVCKFEVVYFCFVLNILFLCILLLLLVGLELFFLLGDNMLLNFNSVLFFCNLIVFLFNKEYDGLLFDCELFWIFKFIVVEGLLYCRISLLSRIGICKGLIWRKI